MATQKFPSKSQNLYYLNFFRSRLAAIILPKCRFGADFIILKPFFYYFVTIFISSPENTLYNTSLLPSGNLKIKN
jgi:hypothetical protein